MSNLVRAIMNQETRPKGKPYNILCFPTHEAYDTSLARTDANFYAFRRKDLKDWDTNYRPVPDNYHLLPFDSLPDGIDFDFIMSANKFANLELSHQLANQLGIPVLSLEHCLPHDTFPAYELQRIKQFRGHVNVFISEFSRERWGWGEDEAHVIHHCIDSEVFKPLGLTKEPYALSVVNDWVNRDWACGFQLWQRVTKDFPTKVKGNTPGLSESTKSVEELVQEYNKAQLFLNTSLFSPIPTVLLEAMSCGTCVISTDNSMISSVIKHGQNGLMTNDETEMRQYLDEMLVNPERCEELGRNARETIIKDFSLERFVENWNRIFEITTQWRLS